MGVVFNSRSVKRCRVSTFGHHFGHNFGHHFGHMAALERSEHWSQAEHVQKRPFRDELHGRRRRKKEAPSHQHGPSLASAAAELRSVLSISPGEG